MATKLVFVFGFLLVAFGVQLGSEWCMGWFTKISDLCMTAWGLGCGLSFAATVSGSGLGIRGFLSFALRLIALCVYCFDRFRRSIRLLV